MRQAEAALEYLHPDDRKFVCVIGALCKRPPIRHRGQPPEAGLSPFEMQIALTCAALARDAIGSARHQHALRAGKAAIRRERQHACKALTDYHVDGVAYQFALAGKVGYAEGEESFARQRRVVLEIAPSGLLRAAGRSRNGKHLKALADALERLTEPLGKLPPPLHYAEQADGRLRLTVNTAWIPRRRFERVPWPAPASGPLVIALYLFLFGTDQRRSSYTSMKRTRLYQIVGITSNRPAHARRSLDRALRNVNAHLAKLGVEGFPTGFELVDIEDTDRVRLNATHDTVAKLKPKAKPARATEEKRKPIIGDGPCDDSDHSPVYDNHAFEDEVRAGRMASVMGQLATARNPDD